MNDIEQMQIIGELFTAVPDMDAVLESLEYKGIKLSSMTTTDAMRVLYLTAQYYEGRLNTLQSHMPRGSDADHD